MAYIFGSLDIFMQKKKKKTFTNINGTNFALKNFFPIRKKIMFIKLCKHRLSGKILDYYIYTWYCINIL